jgi:hypothetical protein
MIVAICGGMGSGKTLTMSYMAYQEFKEHVQIYSNYGLKLRKGIITKKLLLEYVTGDTQLKDCCLCIDEMQTLLDCRDFGKKDNKLISYLILQTRKKGVNLYYTTQQFYNVEVRLRRNTDIIINCSPIYKGTGRGKVLKAVVLEFCKIGQYDVMTRIKKMVIKEPQKLYHLYDTNEIIRIE